MKKKIFTIPVLALAAVAALGLASCDSSSDENAKQSSSLDSDNEKEAINVWATAAEQEVIETLVAEYNETHENDFNITFTAVSESDCGSTLSKDPTVSGAPALFLCADDQIATLQSKNIVAEIKNTRKQNVINSTTEVAVAGATIDDKLYGYPVTSDNGYFLWYNKLLISESEVATLEGILEKAESLGKSFLMDVANGWYANSFIMSPQAEGTSSLYWYRDSDNNPVYEGTWDSDKAAEVSEYIASLLTPAYSLGTLEMGSNDAIVAGFKDGSLIAAVSGTWMESDLAKAIGEENLAACKLPTYTVNGTAYQMASFGGSKVYCINKTCTAAQQRTAADLAELLTSKEGQLVRFEKRQSIPCNKEALEDTRYTEHVSIGAAALASQSAYSCVQAQTAEDRYWDVGKAIGQAYIDSQVTDADGNTITWKEFLTSKMNSLRKAAI